MKNLNLKLAKNAVISPEIWQLNPQILIKVWFLNSSNTTTYTRTKCKLSPVTLGKERL